MHSVDWTRADIPCVGEGYEGGWLIGHVDLTETHGEREAIRDGGFLRTPAGRLGVATRTMNGNRLRAVCPHSGETLWLSDEPVAAAEATQVSQLGAGDFDGDGQDEFVLATYRGDVMCFAASSGELKWHRRLDWHINNPRLDLKRATTSSGLDLALTVGNDFDWTGGAPRARINFVRRPSLVLVDGRGEATMVAEAYAEHNSSAHNTWMFDLNDDGLCEIAACGDDRLIWFDAAGRRLFELPCEGDENERFAHPDSLTAWNWRPDRPGREALYLEGESGVLIAGSDGQVLQRRRFDRGTASHMQNLSVLDAPGGRRLIVENIRSRDARLLCLDSELNPLWGGWLGPERTMLGMWCVDVDGDGRPEVVGGSIARADGAGDAVNGCSFQACDCDGQPLYQHVFGDEASCSLLDVADVDGDGRPELLVSVNTPNGPEGRFSLPHGSRQHLLLMRPR